MQFFCHFIKISVFVLLQILFSSFFFILLLSFYLFLLFSTFFLTPICFNLSYFFIINSNKRRANGIIWRAIHNWYGKNFIGSVLEFRTSKNMWILVMALVVVEHVGRCVALLIIQRMNKIDVYNPIRHKLKE